MKKENTMTKKNINHIRSLARAARTNERRSARLLSKARRGGETSEDKYWYAYVYALKAQRCKNKISRYESSLAYA